MAGDPLDGTVTDNTHKKWDPDEPIHRINSPSFNTGQFTRANGDGVSRGCRQGSTGQAALPAWVPVIDDDFKELEGLLVRSYQTWTDIPLTQWHNWYDWNFHIIPSAPYQYLRGEGNTEARGEPGTTPVVQGQAMECEWDTGAFGKRFGPMFEKDWGWPMTGQFAWLAGRWVYDCSHANAAGKMRSELHPIGAVAASRWEAVKFQSAASVLFPVAGTLGKDTPFMPAVQFMFFASRLGGYLTVPKVLEKDYEFIVDLPREAAGRAIVPIGSTPENPRNTVTLGPLQIAAQIDFSPFVNAQGPINNSLQPILTVIKPADGSFPSQVKVTIPLSKRGGGDTYGVMISLGLVDQLMDLGKRVLLVSGSFDEIQFLNRDFDDVAVKFGINGRWHRKFFTNVKNLDKKPLNEPFSFALALDHPPGGGGHILFSCHGKILKSPSQGRVMLQQEPSRLLRVANQPGGREYQWDFDIVNPTNKQSTIQSDFLNALAGTRRIEDEPLGVSDVADRAKNLALGEKLFELKGKACEDLPGLAELVFKKSKLVDYLLSGKITAKAQ